MGIKNPLSASDLVIDKFIKLLPKLKNAYIKIIGGEAIIHPRFFELAKEIVKNNHNLSIHTNFSFPNKKFEEIIDLIQDNCKMSFIASLHLSQVDSVDNFIKKITDLRLYGGERIKLSVCSVLTEDNFLILKDVREKLFQNNIGFTFQRLLYDLNMSSYSEEIECYLKSITPPIDASSKNRERLFNLDTYGLICRAGYNMWHILPDGRVERCFNYHKALFNLGNLENNVYTLRRPLPCLSKKCSCGFPIAHGMLTDKYNIGFAKKIEKRFT